MDAPICLNEDEGERMSEAISVFPVEGRFHFVFRLRRRKSDRRQPADAAEEEDEGNRCAVGEIEETMNGKKSQ